DGEGFHGRDVGQVGRMGRGRLPRFPEAGHDEGSSFVDADEHRLADLVLAGRADLLPFVEAVSWDEAAATAEGLAEQGAVADGLAARVDGSRAVVDRPRRGGNQAPAKRDQLTHAVRAEADDGGV